MGYHHKATPDEPWWAEVSSADKVKYARALRLSQYRREVEAPQRSMFMTDRKLARRQAALTHWRAYLEGTQSLWSHWTGGAAE